MKKAAWLAVLFCGLMASAARAEPFVMIGFGATDVKSECKSGCALFEPRDDSRGAFVSVGHYFTQGGAVDLGVEAGLLADEGGALLLNVRRQFGKVDGFVSLGGLRSKAEGDFGATNNNKTASSTHWAPVVGAGIAVGPAFLRYMVSSRSQQFASETYLGVDADGNPVYGAPTLTAETDRTYQAVWVGLRIKFD